MKGGSFHLPTSSPLSTPMTKQHTNAMRMAATGWTPLVMRVAEIMALMPATEPMDRSMLPVMRM